MGGSRGGSFLKICILGIFDNIASNLSWDRCQKPPKIFFAPRGASKCWPRGGGGGVFLKSAFLVFLVIFLQTWAEIDAKNLPKIFWPTEGTVNVGPAVGASFPKTCILCNFVNILFKFEPPKTSQKFFLPPWGRGGELHGSSRGASRRKLCHLGIIGDISSNLSWDRCQKPPKKFFDPRGGQGGQ